MVVLALKTSSGIFNWEPVGNVQFSTELLLLGIRRTKSNIIRRCCLTPVSVAIINVKPQEIIVGDDIGIKNYLIAIEIPSRIRT